MTGSIVWNGFDRPALDAAYNNMAAVPDSAARLEDWAARSARLRTLQPAELDLRSGSLPRNRFDVFRCGRKGAPLAVFIHGGWWQRNSKEVFSCMSEGPMARGFDVALLGYTLAPDARLTAIEQEIRTGLDCLIAHQIAHDRPARCILSGWSAGGHLAALTMDHPAVYAALSISGVFDLEPIRHCYINDKLGLDADEAAAMSPARRSLSSKPMAVAYGLRELSELQRQSEEFVALRARQGFATTSLPLAGYGHFTILEELASPSGVLADAILQMAG